MIDEKLAQRNKENYSFNDYKQGSATAEYNSVMNDVRQQIDEAKERVSDEGKERLERLYERHAGQLAAWTNKHNSNGAGHVSVMIAGPSGYNMRKHEKFMNREGKLWAEYDELQNIDSKIWAIVQGDKIIKSDDENAIEKLKEKLRKAEEEHAGYKAYNVKARKEGSEVLAGYVLQNSNGRLKGIRDRIKKLERLAVIAEATPREEKEINGVMIIDNNEAQRLQIKFPDKPSRECRSELKKNGFRWSPSQGVWQCYRTGFNYIARAETIINKYY